MLVGIEGEFDVINVDRIGPGQVKIIIEMRAAAPCSLLFRRKRWTGCRGMAFGLRDRRASGRSGGGRG